MELIGRPDLASPVFAFSFTALGFFFFLPSVY